MRRQKPFTDRRRTNKSKKENYFFDSQTNRYYRECERDELKIPLQNSLTTVLLNPLRTENFSSTRQMIEAVTFGHFNSFKKQSNGCPLFVFQTNMHLNVLTRSTFEIYNIKYDQIEPLQSVELPGEVLHYSFSHQFPHLSLNNNEFVLVTLSNFEQKIIKYQNGTPSFQEKTNQKIYSIGLCPDDVIIGSSHLISFLHSSQRIPIKGKVNCIQYPYFSTLKGDLYHIDSLNVFHCTLLYHFPNDILSFILQDDFILVEYLNREISLFDLKTNTSLPLCLPFKPLFFFNRENYLVILNEKEIAIGLFDKEGVLDWMSQESGEFINSIPFILFDELHLPKVLLLNHKELKLSL
ncbi:hypothetical protein EHI8A_088230 [Entamoeba histolytica HM-1:IMSS-B]|uniref:Uncharacterized protein n=6 Tax=Entamoeba histolytica TaxID=5759 RepID=C4M5E5_ENTH1|nr:hypothetical protein EHI_132010 [Entamoeba histolytica HM-1:IMSS]EMD46855.1 Hypothetical protein EHI5A_124020 [Entamoeba histolytica KU27]EMH75891.1 hypothetical protein EHI8A_088230 [Entamoeba histolytica HM-1:IMSS-B]EMS11316.1 hypothetical protein KM1_159580 [Entamoeba histolytica HM-3:IMSS]ENY61901.1 hypothetical protein EHI7A_082120 [Entamoeba histolytica HM-1:IMSS-A]GAT96650.1 hypothetical protein CL6EHI_132010 [Entamoeba histolytica]|eukprot:XP_652604.1 hypothetical protein EHI_132010 [Entamoeba histolytica HM-1:IMSS]